MLGMARVISDLHLHSRFARAVSAQMTVPVISEMAEKKGIGLVGTADFTHPIWLRELQAGLEEAGEGIYRAKEAPKSAPNFVLSSEISSIYSQGGRGRRIHTLVLAPNFETVEKINHELTIRGANLLSDGRPIVGLTAKNIADLVLSVDPNCLIIPAHAWTPHFSLYGSISGFDSIEECYEDTSVEIFAIETGLSSDPAMNWRIGELGNRRIVSFSDAHSPSKLGREATVFELENVSFDGLRGAIIGEGPGKIAYTIEFYPEEGKYHYTGHRNCNVVYSPNETRKKGNVCPVCGRALTVGVMSRVEALATREVETKSRKDKAGVRWIIDKEETEPPYVMMVPLVEIVAEALGSGVASQKVVGMYESMVLSLGTEFKILLETTLPDIERVAGERVAEAVGKVRAGDITIEPGYDGVFGKVKIWREEVAGNGEESDQETLF
jgi:uncharacterized protein (TIGR00375 family)